MVDPAVDDEDCVDDEVALLAAGAEEDDRSAIEVAELGRAALGVLEAPGVVELVPKDEGICVLGPPAWPSSGKCVVRLKKEQRPTRHRI